MRYLGGGIGHKMLAGIIDLLSNLKWVMGKDWDGKIGGRLVVDMQGEFAHGEPFGEGEGEDDEEDEEPSGDEEDEEPSGPDLYDEEDVNVNMFEDEESELGDLDGYDPAEASEEEADEGPDSDEDEEEEWEHHLMPGLGRAG